MNFHFCSYRDLFESSLRTVPEAPPVNAIPDIDSILSGEGDAFFDVNPSQYIGNTQRKQTGRSFITMFTDRLWSTRQTE